MPVQVSRLDAASREAQGPHVISVIDSSDRVSPRPRHPKVRKAIEYINRNAASVHVSVASVAREMGLNPTYLGHLFAEQVGMPMHRYVAEQRIELAKQLLTTTKWQIKRVAYASGHANADWFSHSFRMATGRTPTEYRYGT